METVVIIEKIIEGYDCGEVIKKVYRSFSVYA